MSYRILDPQKTIETVGRLHNRIEDRFPGSSLSKLCGELLLVADETEAKVKRISRPNKLLRAAVFALLVLIICGMVYSASLLDIEFHTVDIAGVISLMEASINDILLMGAAVFFLFQIESRVKRKKALSGLHELRSLCHVIDMHQLTKDPSTEVRKNTVHSPKHSLKPYELGRYLDYCTELLSLTGKVATLYANGTDDAVVLNAITEVENLSMGLSRKIWQKIMMLESRGLFQSE